jgi:SMC interacting uncharacterized protein involved in chromosome segregation
MSARPPTLHFRNKNKTILNYFYVQASPSPTPKMPLLQTSHGPLQLSLLQRLKPPLPLIACTLVADGAEHLVVRRKTRDWRQRNCYRKFANKDLTMAARVPLATVSQNAANARPMMGAPARKSLQGRPSLVGPTRTSTGGSNLAAPRRMTMCPKSFLRPDEPRDVKSIAFRNSAIERIIEFLVTHGYEHQISPKQLGNGGSGPSNKDFAQIFVFLYRQLDTNYKYPKDVKDFKLEDEVPAIFKMLRYPVAITKSQMSTIGAPHAWPYLLAALDWLVELLTYQQQLAAEEQDGIDPADTDKMFFLYTKRSYKAWMEDESGASLDAIERELNQQFASKNVVLEQEIQKMQAEVSLMESELATLRPSLLDDVQKQRSATLEKMDHTISENKALEVQIRELEGSISQLESDNDKRGTFCFCR